MQKLTWKDLIKYKGVAYLLCYLLCFALLLILGIKGVSVAPRLAWLAIFLISGVMGIFSFFIVSEKKSLRKCSCGKIVYPEGLSECPECGKKIEAH